MEKADGIWGFRCSGWSESIKKNKVNRRADIKQWKCWEEIKQCDVAVRDWRRDLMRLGAQEFPLKDEK